MIFFILRSSFLDWCHANLIPQAKKKVCMCSPVWYTALFYQVETVLTGKNRPSNGKRAWAFIATVWAMLWPWFPTRNTAGKTKVVIESYRAQPNGPNGSQFVFCPLCQTVLHTYGHVWTHMLISVYIYICVYCIFTHVVYIHMTSY